MDLVNPASLHFSRAWEGGVVNSHEQSLGMGNKTRIKAEKQSVKNVFSQELALIIRKEKGEEGNDTRRITISF